MRTRYFEAAKPSRRTQGVERVQKRVPLTKDARAAITARRREASHHYKQDLDKAWGKINELTEDIAVNHSKSLSRVHGELHMGSHMAHKQRSKTSAWNAFCWKKTQEKKAGQDKENDDGENVHDDATGKQVLQALVRSHKEEYDALSLDEKAVIVHEFDKHKATKTLGLRISNKSRVNDVTHTLKAIQTELTNLKSRTGVETMLFTTRGSTDMSLRGVAFATEGVEDFLEDGLKTDAQDFIGKMEGFAIQGVKGSAKNHQQRVSSLRTDIRNEIQGHLRLITDDPEAKMQWKLYWRNVVQRYKVSIVGWPKNVPFKSLSEVSNSLADLQGLLTKWRSGQVHWCELSDDEFEALEKEREEGIEAGTIDVPAPRRRRSDSGKKRARETDNAAPPAKRRRSKKTRSPSQVPSDTEDGDSTAQAVGTTASQ